MYQNYLHLPLEAFNCFRYVIREKLSFLTTPNIENKFRSSTESLKRRFYEIATREILTVALIRHCFGGYHGQFLVCLAFKKGGK